MLYETYKEILCKETQTSFKVGDEVTIKLNNGGGRGGCVIEKITDTGFRYKQSTGSTKSVQYKNIEEIY